MTNIKIHNRYPLHLADAGCFIEEMVNEKFNRVSLLVGDDTFEKIKESKVIIFGVGGVGSWAAESLVRTGIHNLTIVDCDRVEETNINRQLPATELTVGEIKTEVVKKRLLEINHEANITAVRQYYTESTANEFNLSDYDYVIDAIDSLSDKALLILNATKSSARFFSSMGAALKMDGSKIDVAEFWQVKGCPLAASLRRKFKKSGIFPKRKFKCVYSPEIYRNRGEQPTAKAESGIQDLNDLDSLDLTAKKAVINGTVAHTTAIFGFMLAGLVIEDICR